ncbi:P-loop NTPase family protein [Microbacterium mangrovi]|uniref:AAA family ATPase n=1 Tax=Microbacterium mangrovi TaxID=1348253 RepID=UPI000A553C41
MLGYADPLPHRPRRILVAGVSGSGKTTLAARIAAIADAPHTEIDGLHHGPHWTPRPEFRDDVTALVQLPSWTTEWQYTAVRPLLSRHADLLVWLDLPFAVVVLPRVVTRTLRRRLRREVLWNGNVEPPLRTFFTDPGHIVRWAIGTRRAYAPLLTELADARPDLPIVRLRTPRHVEAWLSGPLSRAVDGG